MGAEWKKLDAEQKAKWEDKAAKDKVRYQKEMEDYTPPSDDESDGDSDDGKAAKKQKAKRAKKDPNAPKRSMNVSDDQMKGMCLSSNSIPIYLNNTICNSFSLFVHTGIHVVCQC